MDITKEKLESFVETLKTINSNLDTDLCKLEEVMESLRTILFHIELIHDKMSKLSQPSKADPS